MRILAAEVRRYTTPKPVTLTAGDVAAMVAFLPEFRKHLAGLASTDRYVRYLKDVAEASGETITPKSLRSDHDVESFATKLSSRYSEKSISNYRSVMRRYVEMVSALGL